MVKTCGFVNFEDNRSPGNAVKKFYCTNFKEKRLILYSHTQKSFSDGSQFLRDNRIVKKNAILYNGRG